jgi:hypothetical protein
MIVWLASYPRSGNTLLRMLIYRTIGLGSYSAEPGELAVANPEDLFEHLEIPESDWDAFYRRASASPDVHLVKTHRPPRDSQPAIHILRDGRNALTSYAHFHRDIERSGLSLLSLALGADHYESWAEHHLAWTSRTGPMLTISYESMMREPEMLVPRIAEFIGYTGERRPWNNNFSSLQADYPEFFRRASVEWEGDPQWTPFVNGVFFHVQGEAMVRGGYATSEAAEEAVRALPEEALRMSETVRGLLQQQRSSQASLDQRLAVIEELKSAAGNRLEVNARLKAICDERQVLIEDLKRVCDERQALIEELTTALRAR